MAHEKAEPAQEAQTPAGFLHEQQPGAHRTTDDLASRQHDAAQQRERLLRRISEDIRTAADVEEAIERAITALGREMGAVEVVVRLGTEGELLSYAAGTGVAHASQR